MSDVRPVRPVRVAFGLVLAAGLGAFAVVAVIFLGLASPSWGWLYSAAVLFPCLTLGSLLALGPRRMVGYVVSLVVALALGGVLWWNAPPDHGRILDMVDDQDLAGFAVLDEEGSGNTWCLMGCPVVEVDYAADDPALGPAEASEQFVEALQAQGWRESYRSDGWVGLTKDRWTVRVGPSLTGKYGYGAPPPDVDVDVEWGAKD